MHTLTWCNEKGYDTIAMVYLTVRSMLLLEHTLLAEIVTKNCNDPFGSFRAAENVLSV
jgi:hypothetical protein